MNKLTFDESSKLEGKLTLEEITCAVKQMKNGKTPGVMDFRQNSLNFGGID